MYEATERIVVGVDGSVGSKAALLWAIAEARTRHADLEIITCWHPPYLAEASGYGVAYLTVDDMTAEMRQRLELLLHEVDEDLRQLITDGQNVTDRLLEGEPGTRLVTESKGASMLVVGRRGNSTIMRLLLGSVSAHAACHATCPVVVVPNEPTA
jgi:nucleotide-binding universal stress UspA family protein